MIRRLTLTCCLAGAFLPLLSASAGALPGRFLISDGRGGIELFNAESGQVRKVAEKAVTPSFTPRGRGFAYIREGGCYQAPKVCFTQYSPFVKSLATRRAAVPGRQVFAWRRFFVPAVDVAPDGRLVFNAEPGPVPRRGKRLDIYSSAADGSGVRRLTRNRFFEADPAVSPDGRLIAFSRRVRGRGQIFTMRIDGSRVRRVTVDGMRNREPAWSPDGHRIAYISQPAGAEGFRRREIYSIAASGRHRHRLTADQAVEGDPVYSPDGRWIAYLAGSELWAMRVDGTAARLLLAPSRPPGFEGGIDWAR